MKFNEPVRPAGIGRNQVAFDVNRNPSAFTIVEDVENTQTDTQSNEAQNVATLANANAMSRVIAYSAANATASKNQNDIWGLHKILPWTHVIPPSTTPTFSYIHWDGYSSSYGSYDIASSLAYVDGEDPTIIRVTKPGWYLVTVHFFQGAHSLNNHYNTIGIIAVDSPDTFMPQSWYYSHAYPSTHITAMVPVPGYILGGDPASPNDQYQSKGGFQVQYGVYGNHNNSISITPENSRAYIQIAWMRPWEESFKVNFA